LITEFLSSEKAPPSPSAILFVKIQDWKVTTEVQSWNPIPAESATLFSKEQ